jgi:hypothetical protein
MSLTIHGLACPSHRWVERHRHVSADAHMQPFQVRPGGFAAALQRPDLSTRLFVDFALMVPEDKRHLQRLASVPEGSLRLWEEPIGLCFEADLASWIPGRAEKVYRLIEEGFISSLCVSLYCHATTEADTTRLDILQLPAIGDLSLCLMGDSHLPEHTWVRIGQAPPRAPAPAPMRPITPDRMLYRPYVQRVAAS